MVLLIGLAVGVDYSMFYLKREREERASGRSSEEALEIAAATSGRSVLISGAIVVVAMGGMLFAGEGFAPFGVATMIVVAVAVVGSLTVLPAVLSALGDNVERLRVPFVHRLRRDGQEGRVWGAIVDRVLRRPALSAALSGGLLLLIAAPALTLHTADPGIDTYPQGLEVIKTYNRLQQAFPGTEIPANVVVKAADVTSPEVQSAIDELERRAVATGLMQQPIFVDVNADRTVANVAIPIAGKGNDGPSNAALAALRRDVVPATIGAVPDIEVAVGGFAAESKDFNDYMKSVVWFVFAFVLGFAFMLLLFAFRSLVIAAKAIVLNLLSVAAAYGVLVLVFQHGWGKQVLGFETTGGIVPFLPIFLFVILFGLSMDYHVFILSRIREAYDRGCTTDEAISHGIKTTAGVITSAALVMVCVFSVFGILSFMIFKQIGVGLAVAILIDATIVRAILLPASMKLLGDWNWYLPSWLEWLPHLEHGESIEPVVPPTAPPAVETGGVDVTTTSSDTRIDVERARRLVRRGSDRRTDRRRLADPDGDRAVADVEPRREVGVARRACDRRHDVSVESGAGHHRLHRDSRRSPKTHRLDRQDSRNQCDPRLAPRAARRSHPRAHGGVLRRSRRTPASALAAEDARRCPRRRSPLSQGGG